MLVEIVQLSELFRVPLWSRNILLDVCSYRAIKERITHVEETCVVLQRDTLKCRRMFLNTDEMNVGKLVRGVVIRLAHQVQRYLHT